MTARLRSVLFAPATRPDLLRKLPRSAPDGVVIDLEDAVPADAKVEARTIVREVGPELTDRTGGPAVFVRVNAAPTEWFRGDVDTALCPGLDGVVVPKLESAEQVRAVRAALGRAGHAGLLLMAGIETAAGVVNAAEVFAAGVDLAYFGAEDFIADMGGVRRDDNMEVHHARSEVALRARVAGVRAIDMVVADFGDDQRFRSEAELARAMGYAGKLCIHPAQVPIANEAFVPSTEEVARARRIIDAYEQAKAAGQAAIAVDGQMVDEPLARQAMAVIASAD